MFDFFVMFMFKTVISKSQIHNFKYNVRFKLEYYSSGFWLYGQILYTDIVGINKTYQT